MYNHSQLELTCPFSIGINLTHQLVFTFIRFCQLSNFIFAFLHISNIILAFLPISYLPIFVSTGRPYIFHGHYYNSYTYYILINTSGRPEKVLAVLSKRLPREEADIQMSMAKLQAL